MALSAAKSRVWGGGGWGIIAVFTVFASTVSQIEIMTKSPKEGYRRKFTYQCQTSGYLQKEMVNQMSNIQLLLLKMREFGKRDVKKGYIGLPTRVSTSASTIPLIVKVNGALPDMVRLLWKKAQEHVAVFC